jgi:hypothetical protein
MDQRVLIRREMRVFLELGVALCLLGAVGCGGKDHGAASSNGARDGATDAPAEGTHDGGTDAPAEGTVDGGTDAPANDMQDGASDAPADVGCVCPVDYDASSTFDPIVLPQSCYCALAAFCESDGGLPILCVDNDAVESVFAGCNVRRIQYTNGGGFESVINLYNATTGAWIGSRHETDGPDQCGHNLALTGVSEVDAACALTSQRSLCGSADGGSGDASDAMADAGGD